MINFKVDDKVKIKLPPVDVVIELLDYNNTRDYLYFNNLYFNKIGTIKSITQRHLFNVYVEFDKDISNYFSHLELIKVNKFPEKLKIIKDSI